MVVGYGKKIRKAVEKVRSKTTARYICPSCSRVSVRRAATGVWSCRKCGSKFASGAYEFKV